MLDDDSWLPTSGLKLLHLCDHEGNWHEDKAKTPKRAKVKEMQSHTHLVPAGPNVSPEPPVDFQLLELINLLHRLRQRKKGKKAQIKNIIKG